MMKKSIFVLGAYGCGNRGDDAILQSICELFPEWEICAANGSYCDVSAFLPVKTANCRLNEGFSLSVLCSMAKDSLRMFWKIAKSDALVFGGGSLIHDLTPYNLPFLFLWHLWAKMLRKKVFYFSMGVGPVKTPFGKKLCRWFLSGADGLFVRDQRGFEICQQLGLANACMTADAAFAVQTKNQCGKRTLRDLGLEEKNYLCVTASQWFQSSNFWKKDSMDFSAQIENFAACVKAAGEQLHLPIVFVPTVMHDGSLGETLQAKLTGMDFRMVPVQWNCKEMAEIVENAAFLLGVRMHSLIFAARQSVPFLALVYDEKVRQLLRILKMEQYSLPLETVTAQQVQEKLTVIMEQKDLLCDQLASQSTVLRNRVLASTEQMLCALDQTRSAP